LRKLARIPRFHPACWGARQKIFASGAVTRYVLITMIDTIKKTLLAGLGAAVVTKEKVEASLAELVKQGKVSTDEAREMADKIVAQGRKEYETLSHDLDQAIRERFAGIDRRAQERIDALEARVAALEQAAADATKAGPSK